MSPMKKEIISISTHGTIEIMRSPSSDPSPPVILLHGASGNAETWRTPLEQAWSWADAWCPDLPGRGGSGDEPLATAEAVADWLAAIANDAPWSSPAIFVGHSYGGAIALSLALRHPELVSGVVMVSSGSRLRVAPAILDAVAKSTPEAPFALDFAFGEGCPSDLIEAYASAASSTPPGAALADWRACDCFDVRAQLPTLTTPLLVVHGDQDKLTPPKYQRLLADAVSGSKIEEIEGPGHMLPWEDPESLSQVVEAWVRQRVL